MANTHIFKTYADGPATFQSTALGVGGEFPIFHTPVVQIKSLYVLNFNDEKYSFDIDTSVDTVIVNGTVYNSSSGRSLIKSAIEGTAGTSISSTFVQLGTFKAAEQTGTTLTDFPTKVPIPWKQPMNGDFSNIRFILDDGTVIPHWFQPETIINSTSATAWVKLPKLSVYAPASGKYGVYGSSNPGNGVDVFDFFDDFETGSFDPNKWDVSVDAPQSWAYVDDRRPEELLTGLLGNQGLCANGTNIFFGKDNGDGVDGTIYKYNYDGTAGTPTSFAGPAHCNTGDFRADTGNMIWSSAGDPGIFIIREITTAGSVVRTWTFGATDLYYGGAPGATYLSPKRFLIQSNNGGTPRLLAIQQVLMNDDGTWAIEKTWLQETSITISRMQALKFKDGVLYYLFDDSSGLTSSTTRYGQFVGYRLNDDGTMTVVSQRKHLPGLEREGLTHDGTNWLYSAHAGTIYKLNLSDKKATLTCITDINLNTYIRSKQLFAAPNILLSRAYMTGNYPRMTFEDNDTKTELVGFGHVRNSDTSLALLTNSLTVKTISTQIAATADYKNRHTYEVVRQATSVKLYFDGTLVGTATTSVPAANTALSVALGAQTASSTVGNEIGADYLAVRKFVSTEPVVTVS